ncbi:hypothetical protein GGI00_005525, partial [Coemansia sp. RSA 2681]
PQGVARALPWLRVYLEKDPVHLRLAHCAVGPLLQRAQRGLYRYRRQADRVPRLAVCNRHGQQYQHQKNLRARHLARPHGQRYLP